MIDFNYSNKEKYDLENIVFLLFINNNHYDYLELNDKYIKQNRILNNNNTKYKYIDLKKNKDNLSNIKDNIKTSNINILNEI